MRSHGEGSLSATTQMKVLSPEITIVALGQGFYILETNIGTHVKGESVSGMLGLSPWRANELSIRNRAVGIDNVSWESCIAFTYHL